MPITRTPMIDDDGSGTTGTVINAAWKTELYNQIDALAGGASPAYALLTTTAVQSVPAGAWTLLTFPTTLVNVGGFVLSTSRLTIPAGATGLYLVLSTVTTPADAFNFSTYIAQNGAFVGFPIVNAKTFTGISGGVTAGGLCIAAAGDFFECYVYHDAAAAKNFGGAQVSANRFSVARLFA